MGDGYFTDRELGSKPRVEQTISPSVWSAIIAEFQRLLSGNYFAECYPLQCQDKNGVYGTDEYSLIRQLEAEISIEYPFKEQCEVESDASGLLSSTKKVPFAPDTFLILDLIEFMHRVVSKAENGTYHKFPQHHHLNFDKEEGQQEFVNNINRLFLRNGIAYELQPNGQIQRVLSDQVAALIKQSKIASGDRVFDELMDNAIQKFTHPSPDDRKYALEKIWDAFERIKTFADQDKKQSITKIIKATASGQPLFEEQLGAECTSLTRLGNNHRIRHSEIGKEDILLEHVDYLFHRILAMINFLLPAAVMLRK